MLNIPVFVSFIQRPTSPFAYVQSLLLLSFLFALPLPLPLLLPLQLSISLSLSLPLGKWASWSLGHQDYSVTTTTSIYLKLHRVENSVGEEVRHPSRHGQLITPVAGVFGDSDIALTEAWEYSYSTERSRHLMHQVTSSETTQTSWQCKIGGPISKTEEPIRSSPQYCGIYFNTIYKYST